MSAYHPYAARRARLLARLREAGGGVAVVHTAPEVARNTDTDYPYRHDSNFHYLTGFTEPEAALVLDARAGRSILFCREKDADNEIWHGFRHGPELARERCGVDRALAIDALDATLADLLAEAPALYYPFGHGAARDAQAQGWLAAVRRRGRNGVAAPGALRDVLPLLAEMRLFKDDDEIGVMERAAAIACDAHVRAMRATRPGMREYEIEAELLYEFRRRGAQSPAYPSIVAAGANACVLHYLANDALCHDGDLLLIDAGCELDGYASDITRTFPVNGRFSGPQRALYELVLAAQQAALDAVRPGLAYQAGHDAAVRVLTAGMLDLGLLDPAKTGGLDDAIASLAYQRFYMHSTGHWLGLDVHDVGLYRDAGAPADAQGHRPYRTLAPGMVLTVEPGIYVRPGPDVPEQYWNIGIRIEDDVLVTPDGHRVLSAAAPKTAADIERLMRA